MMRSIAVFIFSGDGTMAPTIGGDGVFGNKHVAPRLGSMCSGPMEGCS